MYLQSPEPVLVYLEHESAYFHSLFYAGNSLGSLMDPQGKAYHVQVTTSTHGAHYKLMDWS